MRLHNLIDDLNYFVKTTRSSPKFKPGDADRLEAIERVKFVAETMKEAQSLPQFDVGRSLCDIPDEEYNGLMGYAYELISHDLQLFPYPEFVVSCLWREAQMLIVAHVNEKQLQITAFNKHPTLPLHPGIVAVMNLKTFPGKKQICASLDFAHDVYITSKMKFDSRERSEEATQCLTVLIAFGALLNAKDAKVISTPAPAKLNKSRVRKGKAPIGEIKEIRIVVGNTARMISGHEASGSGSAKRMHWRRGHVRRLASGQITNVRPCLVGSIHSDKVKMPSYKVTKGAA